MTTLSPSRTRSTVPRRRDRAGLLLLIGGGAAFFAAGPLHPTGSDEGDRTEQLHSMLVDPAWYPAHLVALLGFAGVAAGLLALQRDPAIRDRLGRLLPISAAVGVAATLGAVIHLLAATQAAKVEHGDTSPLVAAFMGVETVVNPAWGLMIAALAVAGGRTRAVGNRIVLPLGLLGGLAFALATATIAFVDTFDPLFPVAGLAGAWLVAAGVVGLVRTHTDPGRGGAMTTIHVPPGEGRSYQMIDGAHVAKAAVRDSHGAFEVFEVIATAAPMAPPHVSPWSGVLFLLEGRLRALVGGTTYAVEPGGVVVFPAGTPSTFEVVGESARFVAITSGTEAGRFFADFAGSVPSDRPVEESLETILAVTGRHGVRLAGA